MKGVRNESIEDIERRFKTAVEKRREAEKILDKLLLEREKLIVQRDMLYKTLLIVGADVKRTAERIVNKYAKLVEMKSDLRSDITTSALAQIHKNVLLEQIDKHLKDIEKAYDEQEIEKAISHLKSIMSLVKTMSR